MAFYFLEKWRRSTRSRSRPSTVRSFYTKHGSRSAERIEKRLAEMASATPLHSDHALIGALSTMVGTLVALIRTTVEQIRVVEHRIEQLWSTHPDRAIFDSLPGAGPALAPRLATALGTDRARWTAETLQTFSGIAPVTVGSGSSKWIHARWKCPKFLRQPSRIALTHAVLRVGGGVLQAAASTRHRTSRRRPRSRVPLDPRHRPLLEGPQALRRCSLHESAEGGSLPDCTASFRLTDHLR